MEHRHLNHQRFTLTRGARKKARRIARKKVQHFAGRADQISAFSGEALIAVV